MNRFKSRSDRVGIILTSVILIMTLLGLIWTPYDPDKMSILLKNCPPGFLHPFGTDQFGRDILSRVMKGLFTTLFISFCTVAIGTFFGIVVGAVTGYFGGITDRIIMRFNDALTAFPSILLALIFVSLFGSGKYNVILALGILFIPSFARVIRSEYVLAKEMDYVKNARIMGASHFRIMFVHILPNTFSSLIPCIFVGFNNAVLAEAGMSYLGLGVQPPEASIGRMLSESQSFIMNAPWSALMPGFMIVLMVLGFSLMGER